MKIKIENKIKEINAKELSEEISQSVNKLTILDYKDNEELKDTAKKLAIAVRQNKIKEVFIVLKEMKDAEEIENYCKLIKLIVSYKKIKKAESEIWSSLKKWMMTLQLTDIDLEEQELWETIIKNDLRYILIKLPLPERWNYSEINKIKKDTIKFVIQNPNDLQYTIKLENYFPPCFWTPQEILQLAVATKSMDTIGEIDGEENAIISLKKCTVCKLQRRRCTFPNKYEKEVQEWE